ncbi:MAG TPA: TIGR03086 family metal-binding protein [Streptomyces sp.]|nr:TIGR03086 family metal-binding protein [Streptomyces sp.]
MTDKISELLEEAAAHADPVVRGVADRQLGEATPCADYDVRDLLNHLFHVVVSFQAIAARKETDFSHTPNYLEGEWRNRFAAESKLLVGAWAAPGAEEGTAGSMNLPARTLASMALLDLTVHAWDLARATGQTFAPDDESVRALGALVAEMGPTARQMKVFAEPCPTPGGATPFEELLASTGRDPRWKPGL